MPGIIPEAGPVFRQPDGSCQPTSAQNTYCPDPSFVVSCPLRALPSDCTARLDPAQINAMVSELMAFGEALCPNGEWDCESVTNLANLWNEGCWLETICDQAEPVPYTPGIQVLGCSAGALVTFELPSMDPCDNAEDLAECLIDPDDCNALEVGANNLMFVHRHAVHASEVGMAPSVISMTVAGQTMLDSLCETVVNDTCLPMAGIMRFTIFSSQFVRTGDGSVQITPGISRDGGATWIDLATYTFRRVGFAGMLTQEIYIDNRAATVSIPAGSTEEFCARVMVDVVDPYDGGNMQIGMELEIITGTEGQP